MQRPREPILSHPLLARAARVFAVAWSAVGMVVLTYMILRYVLYPIRIIFPPVLLALILVYLLNPVVTWLGRKRIKRVPATLLTYIVVLTALGFLLSWLIPTVSDQAVAFGKSIPDLLERANQGLTEFATKLGLDVKDQHLLEAFGKTGAIGEYVRRVTSVSSAIGLALLLVLGPILAFYLLVDVPKITQSLEGAIPPLRRAEVLGVGRRISSAVGGYFRWQLLVAASVGAFCMLGFWLIGLPYWALVGLIIGLFSLIPYIGPFLGAIPALFIAFTSPESGNGVIVHPRPGWPLAVAASIVLLIVQQADVLFISPRTLTRRIRLHPVTIMLSLLIAGTIAGVYGMLLAIPAIAAVKILVVHYWDTRMVWPPRGPGEVADRFDGPDVPSDPVTAGPDSDPGAATMALLPDDDPAMQEPAAPPPTLDADGNPVASPATNGSDAESTAEGDADGAGNGKKRSLPFSPGRVARAWRQGRTPEGEQRTSGGKRRGR